MFNLYSLKVFSSIYDPYKPFYSLAPAIFGPKLRLIQECLWYIELVMHGSLYECNYPQTLIFLNQIFFLLVVNAKQLPSIDFRDDSLAQTNLITYR